MSSPRRIELEPAYILHSRAYRETSQILDVFSAAHGRVALVARGVRRPKSRLRGVLNPFQPLRLSWSGRGEMATLTDAEPGGAAAALSANAVLAAFYANELLLKFLQRNDPHPDLFVHYASLLAGLAARGQLEAALRGFELQLLYEIGYALNLERDALSNQPLLPDVCYEFRVEQGAVVTNLAPDPQASVYSGATLLAIGRLEFHSEELRLAAKQLLRHALNYHLGDRGLQTRRIAAAMRHN